MRYGLRVTLGAVARDDREIEAACDALAEALAAAIPGAAAGEPAVLDFGMGLDLAHRAAEVELTVAAETERDATYTGVQCLLLAVEATGALVVPFDSPVPVGAPVVFRLGEPTVTPFAVA